MQRDVSSELWDAYKAGEIDWPELQRREQARQPRCACGAPTNALIVSGPICTDCLRALYELTTDGRERVVRGAL